MGGGTYVVAVVSVGIIPVVSRAIGFPNWSSSGGGSAGGAWSGHRFIGCVPSLNAS